VPVGYDGFMESIPIGIKRVRTHGKFIYWVLDDDKVIFNTLGMAGGWATQSTGYDRLLFQLDDDRILYFGDQRNFGTLKFTTTSALEEKLGSLGPDPLAGPYTPDMFHATINTNRRKKRTIAQTLMDQKMIAGIGNYLKSEILWLTKLSPHRETGSLSEEELNLLCSNINNVPRESFFANIGSSILTYRAINEDQTLSYPDDSTVAVYRKRIDPNGNKIINEETADKRTSWWVPGYQL